MRDAVLGKAGFGKAGFKKAGFLRIWLRGAVLALVGVIAPLGTAMAQDLPLKAFFGRWVGSGVSQTQESVAFQYTHRDLNVTLTEAGTGFALAWTTVQRKKGDPNDPTPVRKTTTTTFIPAGRPNVWRALGSLDPIGGNAYSWARVEGPTLTVYSMEIAPDGAPEIQVYKRTLTGLGMQLEFQRLVDGDVVRTVKGQLTKFAD